MNTRRPHAVLDAESRALKAKKILAVLAEVRDLQRPLDVLEIGTGGGGIASYIANRSGIDARVTAVDVLDQRTSTDGYDFVLVGGVGLPFDDDSFDIVISNHVIEHVGFRDQQVSHLREIRRVMRTDAVAYLAHPNRWMFVEPHYRLPLLSWLPRPWRTPFLRLSGRGGVYDCEPPSLREIHRLIEEADLRFMNATTRALRLTLEIEGCRNIVRRAWGLVPDGVIDRASFAVPTLIHLLFKPGAE